MTQSRIGQISFCQLDGFGKFYCEFAEKVPQVVEQVGGEPMRRAFFSKAAASITDNSSVTGLSGMIETATPPFARSMSWVSSLERLGREPVVLVLARYRVDSKAGSMAQLLKCLTAARLARELELGSVPAIALCWLDPDAIDSREGANRGRESDPEVDPINFIDSINYYANVPIKHEYIHIDGDPMKPVDAVAAAHAALACLARDFRWLAVYPGSSGPMQKLFMDVSDLPIGVVVAGPDDLVASIALSEAIQSAGHARPVVWPRLSATVVDRRSHRKMLKYGVSLLDLLADGDLAERFVSGSDMPAIVDKIEAVSGSSGSVLQRLSESEAAGPRFSRKIRDAGARIAYQLQKIATKSGMALAERNRSTARQLERLRAVLAPGGRLQEASLGLPEVLARFSQSALMALFTEPDPWSHKHQLICAD